MGKCVLSEKGQGGMGGGKHRLGGSLLHALPLLTILLSPADGQGLYSLIRKHESRAVSKVCVSRVCVCVCVGCES